MVVATDLYKYRILKAVTVFSFSVRLGENALPDCSEPVFGSPRIHNCISLQSSFGERSLKINAIADIVY